MRLFGARRIFVPERFLSHEGDLHIRLERIREVIQLVRQREHRVRIGLRQMDRNRIIIIRRFLVHRGAVFFDGNLHIRRHAAWKALREYQSRRGLRQYGQPDRRQNRRPFRHARAPMRISADAARKACVAWQIAIASASLASSDVTGDASRSREATICCTWNFSARPYPTTLFLTSSGEYSAIRSDASVATSIATPRT